MGYDKNFLKKAFVMTALALSTIGGVAGQNTQKYNAAQVRLENQRNAKQAQSDKLARTRYKHFLTDEVKTTEDYLATITHEITLPALEYAKQVGAENMTRSQLMFIEAAVITSNTKEGPVNVRELEEALQTPEGIDSLYTALEAQHEGYAVGKIKGGDMKTIMLLTGGYRLDNLINLSEGKFSKYAANNARKDKKQQQQQQEYHQEGVMRAYSEKMCGASSGYGVQNSIKPNTGPSQ